MTGPRHIVNACVFQVSERKGLLQRRGPGGVAALHGSGFRRETKIKIQDERVDIM